MTGPPIGGLFSNQLVEPFRFPRIRDSKPFLLLTQKSSCFFWSNLITFDSRNHLIDHYLLVGISIIGSCNQGIANLGFPLRNPIFCGDASRKHAGGENDQRDSSDVHWSAGRAIASHSSYPSAGGSLESSVPKLLLLPWAIPGPPGGSQAAGKLTPGPAAAG